MSASKHIAQLGRKMIEERDKAGKDREQRWRARQILQEAEPSEDEQRGDGTAAKNQQGTKQGGSGDRMAASEGACACDISCNFAIVLANLSRVLWIAYEEYELLHHCYTELFVDTQRSSLTKKVAAYWRTFVPNPRPAKANKHPEELLSRCQRDRDLHLQEKAELPDEPVAPIRQSLAARLMDPFGFEKCRCVRCSNLDAVMDYRVALFSLLAEYCRLFEDYAALFWSSRAQLSKSGQEVTLIATELDTKMFELMMTELHTAMSFKDDTDNVMSSLVFLQNLIYR